MIFFFFSNQANSRYEFMTCKSFSDKGHTKFDGKISIKDIATPDIRGSLGAIPGFTGALGVFSFQVTLLYGKYHIEQIIVI